MNRLTLPEGLHHAAFDQKSLWHLWERIAPFDELFADDKMKDPSVFFKRLLRHDTIVLLFEEGFFYLTNMQIGLRGEAHFCVFDHKLSARMQLFKDALLWAFLEFDLHRIETYVAEYAKAVKRFITKSLGFKSEGVMRKRVFHKGRLLDMEIFSILREEVL